MTLRATCPRIEMRERCGETVALPAVHRGSVIGGQGAGQSMAGGTLMAGLASLTLQGEVAGLAMLVLRAAEAWSVAARPDLLVAAVAEAGFLVAGGATGAVDGGGNAVPALAPEVGMVARHLLHVASLAAGLAVAVAQVAAVGAARGAGADH